MPRYLIADCETCGLPMSKSRNVPSKQVSNWPHIVQLAYMVVEYSMDGLTVIMKKDHIIKPRGYNISQESTDIHGITHEYAVENGIDICEALGELEKALISCNHIICHNVDFDLKVLEASYYRCKKQNSKIFSMKRFCTMKDKNIINFCAVPFATPSKFPNRREYKWPKLNEVYNKCFNRDFENAHNAMADVNATKEVFEYLVENDIISLPN